MTRSSSEEAIEPAFRRLPQHERQMLRLRFEEDLTQSEIAARCGVSQMQVSRAPPATLAQRAAEDRRRFPPLPPPTSPPRQPPGKKALRGAVSDLRGVVRDLEDRAKGGPAKRKATAKKAAATRKRNAKKRSNAAKKGARTRAKA